jgi:hypothetical protein
MTPCAPALTESHNMDDVDVNNSDDRAANKTTSTLQLWEDLNCYWHSTALTMPVAISTITSRMSIFVISILPT